MSWMEDPITGEMITQLMAYEQYGETPRVSLPGLRTGLDFAALLGSYQQRRREAQEYLSGGGFARTARTIEAAATKERESAQAAETRRTAGEQARLERLNQEYIVRQLAESEDVPKAQGKDMEELWDYLDTEE